MSHLPGNLSLPADLERSSKEVMYTPDFSSIFKVPTNGHRPNDHNYQNGQRVNGTMSANNYTPISQLRTNNNNNNIDSSNLGQGTNNNPQLNAQLNSGGDRQNIPRQNQRRAEHYSALQQLLDSTLAASTSPVIQASTQSVNDDSATYCQTSTYSQQSANLNSSINGSSNHGLANFSYDNNTVVSESPGYTNYSNPVTFNGPQRIQMSMNNSYQRTYVPQSNMVQQNQPNCQLLQPSYQVDPSIIQQNDYSTINLPMPNFAQPTGSQPFTGNSLNFNLIGNNLPNIRPWNINPAHQQTQQHQIQQQPQHQPQQQPNGIHTTRMSFPIRNQTPPPAHSPINHQQSNLNHPLNNTTPNMRQTGTTDNHARSINRTPIVGYRVLPTTTQTHRPNILQPPRLRVPVNYKSPIPQSMPVNHTSTRIQPNIQASSTNKSSTQILDSTVSSELRRDRQSNTSVSKETLVNRHDLGSSRVLVDGSCQTDSLPEPPPKPEMVDASTSPIRFVEVVKKKVTAKRPRKELVRPSSSSSTELDSSD